MIFLGYVLSSNAHMILVECTSQRITDHGIFQCCMAHTISVTSLLYKVRCLGHGFHTAGYYDFALACLDHVGCHVDSCQTGTAEDIQCHRRSLNRNARIYRRLTCHVLALTCLKYAAHVNHIYLVSRNTGSLQCFLDYCRAQINNRNSGKFSTHFADRCTACTGNYNSLISHFVPP